MGSILLLNFKSVLEKPDMKKWVLCLLMAVVVTGV